MVYLDPLTNQYFIADDGLVKEAEEELNKKLFKELKERRTEMEHPVIWDYEKEISKEQFCKLTRTPKDWHIFNSNEEMKYFECLLLGRVFWRCDTKDTLWVFTRLDNEIVFKIKDKYDKSDYWSEWHDWPLNFS